MSKIKRRYLRSALLNIARRNTLSPGLFVGRRPANAGRERRLIVLALDHVLRAALVEAENFVVEVEAREDHAHAVAHADDALGVDLDVRVEVDVAQRVLHAAR